MPLLFPLPFRKCNGSALIHCFLLHHILIMDAFTPAQTTELVSRIGFKKARTRIDKMFINSFLGGALISFGCALSLSTNSSPWFQTNAPGHIHTISAMVFPVRAPIKSARWQQANQPEASSQPAKEQNIYLQVSL